jgi:hypothetical protein
VKSSIADLDQRSGRGRIVQRAAEKPRGASQMPGDFLEIRPRDFDPKSIAGLATEAREPVNAALKAMSTWRNELADASEKNGKQVIEKMAEAAAALGWPEQIVDATRTQLQSIANMQIKTMDRMMDAWEEQIKSPNPMTASPSTMLVKLKSFPGFTASASWPSTEAFQQAAMNPFQFWMELAENSQKACSEMVTFWSKAAKPH